MGYLTINTRSNRVVIIFNKDTRDYNNVYYVHVPVNHVRYLLLLLIIYRSLIYFVHCSIFISFFVRLLFPSSLFKRKRFNSDPGLYSRYFDPVGREVLYKNTITIYASQ
jgi:hypothetical protein